MNTQHAQGWNDGPAHHRRTQHHALQARTPGHKQAPAHTLAELGINLTELAWHADAACRDTDPEAFFPDIEYVGEVPTVKRICHTCPVRAACLDYALTRPSLVGIWGGLTTHERRTARGRLRTHRQHPPEEEAA